MSSVGCVFICFAKYFGVRVIVCFHRERLLRFSILRSIFTIVFDAYFVFFGRIIHTERILQSTSVIVASVQFGHTMPHRIGINDVIGNILIFLEPIVTKAYLPEKLKFTLLIIDFAATYCLPVLPAPPIFCEWLSTILLLSRHRIRHPDWYSILRSLYFLRRVDTPPIRNALFYH